MSDGPILVTGGGGQLADALSVFKDVMTLDQSMLDITRPEDVSRRLDEIAPAALVNAAAFTAVDAAEAQEELATRVNGHGVGILATSCRARGIKLVHVSTDFVFDGTAVSPIPVDHPIAPISAYGRSKAEGEKACLEILGDSALIVRTAWVYASGHHNFVATMLRLMKERDEVSVVDDQRGTPTCATTLASAIVELIARGATGLHHVTDGGEATWFEFAVAIRELALELGLLDDAAVVKPVQTSEYPTPAKRPCYSVLDKTPTFETIGGVALDWRSSLRRCLLDWNDPK